MFPHGINPFLPQAELEYEIEITFSALNDDLFTRCTHNNIYSDDLNHEV